MKRKNGFCVLKFPFKSGTQRKIKKERNEMKKSELTKKKNFIGNRGKLRKPPNSMNCFYFGLFCDSIEKLKSNFELPNYYFQIGLLISLNVRSI